MPPSPKEKFPRDAEKTRARILEAALELFSNSAYDKVRSRDIAALASVDVALINRYFGSKKGLFAAVLDSMACARPQLQSDELESRLCEDFARRLSGEELRHTSQAVRLMAFSASSAEVAPMLQCRMRGEIGRLASLLGSSDRTAATALIAYTVGMHTLLHMLPEEERTALRPEILLVPIRSVFRTGEQDRRRGGERETCL
ncbi:TetR/AcrR family transcriptional regulator [Mailhella sp.]|uniref:TetR/AcrR family transcriptional regulator n=1 Tax=Mailhella sp. TaxID=1981029 RepID=UPI0040646C37